MIRTPILLIFIWMLAPVTAAAQDRVISLAVSPVLQESGLMKYLLPRFSLKTGVAIDLSALPAEGTVPPGTDVVLTNVQTPGRVAAPRPVMAGFDQTFLVISRFADDDDSDRAKMSARFIDWLFSDVGRRTIEKFDRDGVQLFAPVAAVEKAKPVVVYGGNQISGEDLSYRVCGRCHVIGERNRMNGIGSTPSFPLLRTFDNWQTRFEEFYTLNPHPSFSQIIGVTAPFDPSRPPPISPIELTVNQLNDIVAYVATIKPVNLGAPIRHQ